MTQLATRTGRLGATLRAPVSIVFLFHGLVLGAWATEVPLLRDRLGLAPAALGMALFCASVGALATMPFASRLAARFGDIPVLRGGTALACAAFVAAARAPSYAGLCVALLVFGAGYGVVDVVMNACAVQAEQRARHPILGAVHAMWSVGSCIGSAGGAALLTIAPGWLQAVVLAGLAGGAILLAAGRLTPSSRPSDAHAAHRPWRDRSLLLIGGLLSIAFAVEGAIADWSGIFLHASRQVPASYAALGYSAFSLSVVILRLLGDQVRGRLGNARVLGFALLASAGMALVLLSRSSLWAIAGFAIIGMGVANVVPALFALAGLRGGGAAVGAAATMAYAGVLAGPPIFGAVAQATSLSLSLGLVAVLCALMGLAGLRARWL